MVLSVIYGASEKLKVVSGGVMSSNWAYEETDKENKNRKIKKPEALILSKLITLNSNNKFVVTF